jgi:hypothetical protein
MKEAGKPENLKAEVKRRCIFPFLIEDDDTLPAIGNNAGIFDAMAKEAERVRYRLRQSFYAGRSMVGCPWLKALIVALPISPFITSPACQHIMLALDFACSRVAR